MCRISGLGSALRLWPSSSPYALGDPEELILSMMNHWPLFHRNQCTLDFTFDFELRPVVVSLFFMLESGTPGSLRVLSELGFRVGGIEIAGVGGSDGGCEGMGLFGTGAALDVPASVGHVPSRSQPVRHQLLLQTEIASMTCSEDLNLLWYSVSLHGYLKVDGITIKPNLSEDAIFFPA